MRTIRRFEHNGHSYEFKSAPLADGIAIKIFVDGEPAELSESTIPCEVIQDAFHEQGKDAIREIADVLEATIKDV